VLYCPICGTSNRDGSKYCNECGGNLSGPTRPCAACGALNPDRNSFCGNCGAPLPVTTTAAEEARSGATSPTTPPAPWIAELMGEDDPELAEFEADVPDFDFWPPTLLDRAPEEAAPVPSSDEAHQAVATDGNLTIEDRAMIAWYRAMCPIEGSQPASAPPAADALPAGSASAVTVPVEETPSEAARELADQGLEPLVLPDWLDLEAVSAEELPDWLDLDLKEVLEAEAAWTGSVNQAEIQRALESLDNRLLVDEESDTDLLPMPAVAPVKPSRTESGPPPESPTSSAEPKPVSNPIAAAALPDWLEMEESVGTAPVVHEQSGSPEPTLTIESLPDWLFIGEQPEEKPVGSQEVRGTDRALFQPVAEEGSPLLALPDWLETAEKTLPPGETKAEAITIGEPVSKEAGPSASLPEWLEMVEPDSLAPTAEPIVTESWVPAEQPSVAGLPDWLEMQEPVETKPAASDGNTGSEGELAVEGLPDWLFVDEEPEMQPVGSLEAEIADQLLVQPIPREDTTSVALPEWLEITEEAPSPEEMKARPVTEDKAVRGETELSSSLPAWLEMPEPYSSVATAGSLVAEYLNPPEAGGLAAELPEWLDDTETLPPEPTVPKARLEAEARPAVTELPEWLWASEEAAPTGSSAVQPTASVAAEPVAHALPEWLFAAEEDEIASAAEAGTRRPPPSGGPTVSTEPASPTARKDSITLPLATSLPSWLTEDEDDGGTPAVGSREPSSPPQGPASEVMDEPAPPASMLTADPSISLVVDVEQSRLRQTMVQGEATEPAFAPIIEDADLPAWLAADHEAQADKERTATVVATRMEDKAAPESNELAPEKQASEMPDRTGITLAKTFQKVRFPAEQVDGQLSAQKYAEIFKSAMKDEAPPKPDEKQQGNKIAPRIISVLLLSAVLVPFFVPLSHPLPASSSTSTARNAIERLPVGSAVLVSFDWNGTVNDEMLPVARVLIRHLIAREAKIVAVSVVPEGGKLAQLAIDQERTGHNYVYGRDYVILGYHPGDETAVRLLLDNAIERSYPADFSGVSARELPLLRQVSDLRDISLIVDIAGDPEFMRWWARQLSMSELGLDSDISIVGGITATGGPEMTTYVQSGQLAGLVTGIRGAAQYEGKPDQSYSSLNAQSYAGLVIFMCILTGNAIYLFRRRRK